MSGVGVTQEGSEDREYCLQTFYLGHPNRCEIHCVFTWNIEAHLTVVKEEYKKKGAVLGYQQIVEFESDFITLDILVEGVNNQGWEITPLLRPVMIKKQVDNFREGKLTPCCQLKAEFTKRMREIPTIKHRISLKGAKYPHDFFIIDLPAAIDPSVPRVIDIESDASQSPTFEDVHPSSLMAGFYKSLSEGEMKQIPVVPIKKEKITGPLVTQITGDSEMKSSPTLPIKTEITGPVVTQSTSSWHLRGVDVCAEMTVVVYSSHTQQITWEDFGLKLYIRKGSLPVGMEQCIINIKASLAGQYKFPENSHLVSALFWLRCETVHSFAKQITLEIEHCARFESNTNPQLSFVKAFCSQKQLPYTFKELGGDFTSHSSYGIIELNSFSGNGVILKGSNNKLYRSRLFYLEVERNTFEIHFVVTCNTKTHLTVVMEEYKKEGARPGPDQNIEFEADMITLNIPLKGKTISGWKITPLIRPVITKKDVDDFKPGKGTPRCLFKVELLGKRKAVPALQHPVTLKGAKYPHNFVTLDIPAGAASIKRSRALEESTISDLPPNKEPHLEGERTAVRTSQRLARARTSRQAQHFSNTSFLESGTITGTIAAGLDTKLSLNADHYKVTTHLQGLNIQHIRNVGGALGLSFNAMERMNTFPDDMVAAWLRREAFVMSMSGEPSWRTLVEALRKVGQEGTARDIEEAEAN